MRQKQTWLDFLDRMLSDNFFQSQFPLKASSFEGKDKETMTFTKGGKKHEANFFFNEKGALVGWSHTEVAIPTEEDELENQRLLLEAEKQKAIENDDYEMAAELRDRLKSLKLKEPTN